MMKQRNAVHCDDHCSIVMKKLDQQRKNKSLYDVTLVVEETRLFAHKAILAACSDYFKARFTDVKATKREVTSLKHRRDVNPDGGNHVVVLPGIKAAVMRQVLDYMYSGTIEIERRRLVDLSIASCLLQIPSLIDVCVRLLSTERQPTVARRRPIRSYTSFPRDFKPAIRTQESREPVRPFKDSKITTPTFTNAKPKLPDDGKFPRFSENHHKMRSVKTCDVHKDVASFHAKLHAPPQRHLATKLPPRGVKSSGDDEQFQNNRLERHSDYDVTSLATKKRKLSNGGFVRSNPDVDVGKLGRALSGFLPPMYFNPPMFLTDGYPPTWGFPPHVFAQPRNEQVLVLPGNHRATNHIPPPFRPTSSTSDVSSIKHLRKRKLMSAALPDSGTDTESVGTGSVDSGVAVETFSPNLSNVTVSVVGDMTSLKQQCKNDMRRHQQCVM